MFCADVLVNANSIDGLRIRAGGEVGEVVNLPWQVGLRDIGQDFLRQLTAAGWDLVVFEFGAALHAANGLRGVWIKDLSGEKHFACAWVHRISLYWAAERR